MRSEDDAQELKTKTYNIPPGVTNAVQVTLIPRVLYSRVDYMSGGSLLIMGVTGTALGVTALALGFSTMDYTEVLLNNPITIAGPAVFYLAAFNATCVVAVTQGLSSKDGALT